MTGTRFISQRCCVGSAQPLASTTRPTTCLYHLRFACSIIATVIFAFFLLKVVFIFVVFVFIFAFVFVVVICARVYYILDSI